MEKRVEQINFFILQCSNRRTKSDSVWDSIVLNHATDVLIHLCNILFESSGLSCSHFVLKLDL